MTIKIAVGSVLLAGLIAGGIALGIRVERRNTSEVPACIAKQGEICPSPEFVAVYRRMVELSKEVDETKANGKYSDWQDKQWMLVGMSTDLTRAVPSGYRWDAEKLKFVVATPVPPAPPK